MLPDIGPLPKGWPPLGPTEQLLNKLHEGKVLTELEMAALKKDAENAERLEATDPDYMRAVKRYRAQCAEEDRIQATRKELEEKAKTIENVRNKAAAERTAKQQARLRRLQRGDLTRKEVSAARDQYRSKLLERIALTERRTLVRDTIQKALVTQSRNDGHAERIMFTHPKMLGDGPGPGTYDAPPAPDKGASFANHPDIDIRTKRQPRPGPGSYDPRYSGGPAITFGSLLPSDKKSERGTASNPGPGAYSYKAPSKPGGTISAHVVKSSLEIAIEQAREEPGPGAYELSNLAKGKSSTMSGRTRGANDLIISQAARRPGPGTYDLPPGRKARGGAMGVDKERERMLPSLAPGPGAYHTTPTIKQEAEMRMLSKQVVKLVKSRQMGARSAPEAGREGMMDDAQALLESGMSLGARSSFRAGPSAEPIPEEASPYG